jgi:hypothetical protein
MTHGFSDPPSIYKNRHAPRSGIYNELDSQAR